MISIYFQPDADDDADNNVICVSIQISGGWTNNSQTNHRRREL